MSRTIAYIQDQHPNSTETFVQSEIRELIRRDYDVKVISYKLNEEYARTCGYAENIISHGTSFEGVSDEQKRRFILEKVQTLKPAYIHSHFATESHRLAYPVAKQLGIPFGFTVHAYDIWLRGARIEPEVLSAMGNDSLCATASSEGSSHRKFLQYCGIPESKLLVTPNSVDENILPAKKVEYSSNLTKLVVVGRPVIKKGFFVAIDAVRLLRLMGHDIKLEIIGGTDSSKPLGEQLGQYISHFPFISACPLLSHQETLKKIRSADALLMPSIVAENGDSDGIPTVMAEAMLLKVPVVASEVGSISDLVIQGKTGFLARSGDVADLVEKILQLREHYRVKSELKSLIERAYLHAKQQEIQSSANSLCAHLERMLGSFR